MTISQAAKFLEDAFDALNKEYFESTLSKPIITIQSSLKTCGHFATQEIWKDTQRRKSYNKINIIAALVHEMVHYYCAVNDIQDTGRGGTYHNKRFKEELEKSGLLIDYDAKIGYFITQPAPALKTFCTAQHWRSKLPISVWALSETTITPSRTSPATPANMSAPAVDSLFGQRRKSISCVWTAISR